MLIVSTFTIDEHSFKEMYKLAHTKWIKKRKNLIHWWKS
jgi:hypothetical protein